MAGLGIAGSTGFTEAQLFYLTDVLGASPKDFHPAACGAVVSTPRIVVLTPPLAGPEQTLLQKILGSAHLRDYELISGPHPELPHDLVCLHVIVFGGSDAPSRRERDSRIWWALPSLSAMIGTSVDVGQKKKDAWNLLQQLMKEAEL